MVVGVHRQQYGLRARAHLEDLASRVAPVQQRHREIQDGDGRAALARGAHGGLTVLGLGDDGKSFALQQGLEPLPDYGVVVSEQDSIRHGRPPKERP